MTEIFKTPYQVQKIALSQISTREANLIREELDRDFYYEDKDKRQRWFEDQMADLQEWIDHIENQHRRLNSVGLGTEENIPAPRHPPFPRTFLMLGDEAAGESMCDEISKLFISITLILSMQKVLGVPLGDYEQTQRRATRSLRPRPLNRGIASTKADGLRKISQAGRRP